MAHRGLGLESTFAPILLPSSPRPALRSNFPSAPTVTPASLGPPPRNPLARTPLGKRPSHKFGSTRYKFNPRQGGKGEGPPQGADFGKTTDGVLTATPRFTWTLRNDNTRNSKRRRKKSRQDKKAIRMLMITNFNYI